MIYFTKIYSPKKRFRKDGTSGIYIRAYKDARNFYINPKIRVKPEQWSDKLKRVINHRHASQYNKILNELQHKLENYVFSFEQHYNTDCELENLKDVVDDNADHQKTFLEFFEKQINSEYQSKQIKKHSYKNKKNTYNKLKAFKSIILFNMIDYKFIKEFDAWLKRYPTNLKVNSIAKHHAVLRAMINKAIKYNLLEKNPYRNFSIKYEKTQRTVLTPTELQRLDEAELNIHESKIRDMFIFSAYTSVRFGDLIRFKQKHIHHRRDGIYLCYNAQKTGKYIELPIDTLFDGKPLDIYNLYKKKNPNAAVFGSITNQYANRTLKKIIQSLSIKKDISMHTARHTFATYMASRVPTPVLQQIMQHSDIRTTMIYVQMSNSIIKETIKGIDWS